MIAFEGVKSLARDTLVDRIRGCLVLLLAGDALAMPAHWYYNLSVLREHYGSIAGYVAPKAHLPGSILNLSHTGGGGRGPDTGEVVGSVILHDKRKFWRRGADFHYHQGMAAGENTLEAQLTRVVTRSVVARGSFDAEHVLAEYIEFMTTPGTHNDTYAGTCHRMFFANWKRGIDPEQCADNDGHNTDAIDVLVNLPPVVLVSLPDGADAVVDNAARHSALIRRSTRCQQYARWYAGLLVEVLATGDVRAATERWGRALGLDVAAMVDSSRGSDPMTACYLDSSVPALLHFAYKYASDPVQGLLASVNAGGENVARGAALGALFGAATGFKALPAWVVEGLVAGEEAGKEATALAELVADKLLAKHAGSDKAEL